MSLSLGGVLPSRQAGTGASGAPGPNQGPIGGDGGRRALVITEDGLQAIGVEVNLKTGTQSRSAKQKPKQRSRRKPSGAKPDGRTSPAAVRPGTKQALLIDLLTRKKGATIEEIVEATGPLGIWMRQFGNSPICLART